MSAAARSPMLLLATGRIGSVTAILRSAPRILIRTSGRPGRHIHASDGAVSAGSTTPPESAATTREYGLHVPS